MKREAPFPYFDLNSQDVHADSQKARRCELWQLRRAFQGFNSGKLAERPF
jgi:hypothetical protein